MSGSNRGSEQEEMDADTPTYNTPKPCNACKRENESGIATWWCIDCRDAFCISCERQHKKFKSSSSHSVVCIEKQKAIINEPQMKRSLHENQNSNYFCEVHTDMKIEAYCYSHGTVCCLSCALFHHKRCRKVETTKAAVQEMRSTSKLEDLRKSLERLKLKLWYLYNGRKRNIGSFLSSSAEIKSNIEKMALEYINLIKELEQKVLQSVAAYEAEVEPEIERQKEEMKHKISDVENKLHFLQSDFFETASDIQFLREINDLQKNESEIQKFISCQENKLRNTSIHFEGHKDLLDFKDTLHSAQLGRIWIEKKCLVRDVIEEIDVKDDVTGVEFLVDGRLLISKLNSKEMQLWDCGYLKMVHSLPLLGKPWGIKMINLTQGGVILGGLGLSLFEVKDDKIVLLKKTEKSMPMCRDFAVDGDCIYIGSEKEIQVYDCNLNYTHKIDVQGRVRYLTLRDGNSLCYTNFDQSALHCVTLDGTSIFKYANRMLWGVNGVSSDTDGNLYVCASKRKSVLRINSDGTTHREIFWNLPEVPLSISLNMESDKLVLGCRGKVFVLALL